MRYLDHPTRWAQDEIWTRLRPADMQMALFLLAHLIPVGTLGDAEESTFNAKRRRSDDATAYCSTSPVHHVLSAIHSSASEFAKSRRGSRVVMAANAISLDVVAIGIFWQWLVGLQIAETPPRRVDLLILGLTIWLIYTMDRWLDARQLDPQRLHTVRHRFHYENRRGLLVAWISALAIDAVLVAWQLSPGELRLVVLGTAGVLIYMACVHLFAATSSRYFGKELAIGPLFAFGVFIPTLDQHPEFSTWLCWFGLSTLYTLNCILVADHDRMADQAQKMRSIVSRDSLSRRNVLVFVASYLVLVIGLCVLGVMTLVFAAALIFATLMMTLVFGIASRNESLDASGWFDLAVVFAPLLAFLFPW